MKAKKIIAMTMAATLAVISAGCGEKETNEKTKISILFSEGAKTSYNDNWLMVEEIEKRQDVELEVQAVPASDYATKRSIILASDDIPDILANTFSKRHLSIIIYGESPQI